MTSQYFFSSNKDDVRDKMILALNEAKENFLKDSETHLRMGIKLVELKDVLSEIEIEIKQEIIESNFTKINQLEGETQFDTKIKFYSDKLQKQSDYYVIIPISKGVSDGDVYNCLLSVILNMKGLNFSLLIILNQKDKNCLKFLDDRKISYAFFDSKIRISLPEAYNKAVFFLRNEKKFEGIISFMDDDAYIVGDQHERILHNFEKLKNDPLTTSTSGHYYDSRSLPSLFFQSIVMTNTVDYTNVVDKPYCHGGAFLSMYINNYPVNGLTLHGLGGINLSINQINNLTNKDLEKIEKEKKWFLYNNNELVVFHKLKENIIQWSATYLSYELAWAFGLNLLDKYRAGLWEKKLEAGSKQRYSYLIDLIKNNTIHKRYSLGCILLTKYYKPLLKERFKYNEFKNLIERSHSNLQ